jgi:hypothetical protein
LSLERQITVVLGERVAPPPRYVDHPRVHFVDAATFTPSDVPKCFAPDQKTIIITQPLPHAFYVALGLEVRRRGVQPIYQPSAYDVARALDRHFGRLVHAGGAPVHPEIAAAVEPSPPPDAPPPDAPPTPDDAPSTITPVQPERSASPMPKRTPAPKGAIAALIAEHDDPSEIVARSGERIFAIAKKRGVSTTLESVLQRLYVTRANARRAKPKPPSKPPKPPSKPPTSAADGALARLDGAIGELQALRAELERLTKENADLRERFDKARALVASFDK